MQPNANQPTDSQPPELPRPPFDEITRIDLVVCTHNRDELLQKTIDSLKRLIVPYQVSLRVIVVDNGSSDDTPSTLHQFANDPTFTKRHRVLLLNEARQGHTFARNKAIEHLDSDLTIWTDDDVAVDAFLIQHYVEFANANADVTFFGGKIVPDFENTPPVWISENWDRLSGCFAARDLGSEAISFSDTRLPYGANFSIRSSVQSAFPFDVSLGRRGDAVHGEDELEMLRRVLAEGYSGRWLPKALVKHFIPAARMTESYVRDYFIGQGRAMVAKGETWSKNPKSLMWRSLRKYLAYRFKRRFASSEIWISLLLESALAEGQSLALKAVLGDETVDKPA